MATTFGHLIDDLKEVGKAPRRSKAFALDARQSKPGSVKIGDLTRERLIPFGKDRAKEGAGGVTISMEKHFRESLGWASVAERGGQQAWCRPSRPIREGLIVYLEGVGLSALYRRLDTMSDQKW